MQKIARKHPKALPYLFLTEMWERFGFYVVQGLLVLFLTQGYGFSDDKSFTILGSFSALAYIAPMIGGMVADKVLGFKKSIFIGGLILSSGYALLALSNQQNFYYALAVIVVGNGLFKPNISSLLGVLYDDYEQSRDAGFTFFYVGINIGALLAGFSSGFIKNHFGWHAGFALASAGLILGVFTFAAGVKWGGIKYKFTFKDTPNFWLRKPLLVIYCFFSFGLIGVLLENEFVGEWFLPAVGVIILIYIFLLAYKYPPIERNKLLALNVLIISSIIFWMIWMQIFFSANLFIDRIVNRDVFGIHIPTTVFYTLESIFVITLGPIFAWYWQRSGSLNNSSSHFTKFVFAIVFLGFGFIVLSLSTFYPNDDGLVSPLWIVASYFLITFGEMLLSPIGLSAVTMLSPPKLTGMMMGIWFVALGFGGAFAGWLAKFSSVPEHVNSIADQLPIYRLAFLDYALIAFGVSILLFILQLWLKKKLKLNQ